ncbi:MAG: ATP--guanido phosphotransferase [Longimicrobiaceae bacterium]
MSQPPDLSQLGLEWLDASGPHAEIVLSTRIRLARNLRGPRFGPHSRSTDRSAVREMARDAVIRTDLLRGGPEIDIPEVHPSTRQLLLERRLVSRELIGGDEGNPPDYSVLFIAPGGVLAVMANEEDHLRLQALMSGFRLQEAWRTVDGLDDEMGKHLPYAFHPEFGYLTSCPTNTGSGLRASVLMHLPGLVLTKEIEKVLRGIMQVGLTFRGLHGEGSEVVGNFFQISNQTTLGRTEEDLVDHLEKMVQQVIQHELHARSVLLRDAPIVIEDKVWRAYGILRHARAISFEEVMNLLSGVRLGVSLKLLPEHSVFTLNQIMIHSQSAHLEERAGQPIERNEVGVRRATFVRDSLAGEVGGDGGNGAGRQTG